MIRLELSWISRTRKMHSYFMQDNGTALITKFSMTTLEMYSTNSCQFTECGLLDFQVSVYVITVCGGTMEDQSLCKISTFSPTKERQYSKRNCQYFKTRPPSGVNKCFQVEQATLRSWRLELWDCSIKLWLVDLQCKNRL